MSWFRARQAIKEIKEAAEETVDDDTDEMEDEKDKPALMSATHMSK